MNEVKFVLMKEKRDELDLLESLANNEEDKFPEYLKYPVSEDIYRSFKEEKVINPEDIFLPKYSNEIY